MATLYSSIEDDEFHHKSDDVNTSLLLRCRDIIESLHAEIEEERRRRQVAEELAKGLKACNEALEVKYKELIMKNAELQGRFDQGFEAQLKALEAKHQMELRFEKAQRLADKAKCRDILLANKQSLESAFQLKDQELNLLKEKLKPNSSPLSEFQQRLSREIDHLTNWRNRVANEQVSDGKERWYRYFIEALTHVNPIQIIRRLELLK